MNEISACIVVHNEEKFIKRCLDSIKDVVDEIIVVHDGECSDITLEICKKYTDKIFIRDYIGEAEPHRPFCFKQSSGDWILQIDADEFLSEELKNEIRNLVSNKDVSAYDFLWKLWDGRKYITRNWPHKRCLFKKSNLLFLGIPHFVAEISGVIQKNQLTMEHRPNYNNYSLNSLVNKWFKWARLQAAFYLKNFSNITKYNYYEKDWSNKIKMRRRFPLILIPLEFVVTFVKSLLSGGFKEGYIGCKVAFMLGIYRVMVNFYIFKQKQYVSKLFMWME